MPNLAELIGDLIAATDQMKQAALGDEWDMVARIQKRRQVLVNEIIQLGEQTPFAEVDIRQLREVRRQEATIATLASARRQALSEAILATQTGVRAEKTTRMQRAYGDTDRRR